MDTTTPSPTTPGKCEPCWTLGLTCLTFAVALLTIRIVVLSVGIKGGSALLFWVGLAIASSFLIVRAQLLAVSRRLSCLLLLVFWAGLGGAIVASSWVLDNSWDGLTYHQEFIQLLRDDWNPLYEPIRSDNYYLSSRWVSLGTWSRNFAYTKGFETVGSLFYAVCNQIEAAKAVHWILYAASALISTTCFSMLMERSKLPLIFAVALGAIAASNPVVITQLFTTYVDGEVASGLLCLTCAFGILLLDQGRASSWYATALSVIYLLGLKVYCLPYALLFLVLGTVAFIFLHKASPQKWFRLLVLECGAVAAGMALSFNPYFVSAIEKHDPFCSLKSAYALTVYTVRTQQPPGLICYPNPLTKLFFSLFGGTSNSLSWMATTSATKPLELMPPFSISAEELEMFRRCDIRVGGFGPWFGEILALALVSTILWAVLKGSKLIRHQCFQRKLITLDQDSCVSKEQAILLWLSMTIAVTSLLNPINWWARYVPQLWLIPILLMTTIAIEPAHRRLRPLAIILACLASLNIGFVSIPNWRDHWLDTQSTRRQLMEARNIARKNGRPLSVFYRSRAEGILRSSSIQIRLKESQIPFQVSTTPPSSGSRVFHITLLPIYLFDPQR